MKTKKALVRRNRKRTIIYKIRTFLYFLVFVIIVALFFIPPHRTAQLQSISRTEDVPVNSEDAINGIKETQYDSLLKTYQEAGHSDNEKYELLVADLTTSWTQRQKLAASDGGTGQQFGYSVAISGDTAIIGSPFANAAYVFVYSEAAWTQQQKLTPSDGVAGDRFGFSVAMSGDIAIIGAPGYGGGADPERGAAYYFLRSGTVWTQRQKLLASDGNGIDNYGFSVAVSGNSAVIGAPHDGNSNGEIGSIYAYNRTVSFGSEQKIKPTDLGGSDSDEFGKSVAIAGNRMIVGSPGQDAGGILAVGAVYTYTNFFPWSQTGRRTPPLGDQIGNLNFGERVAISASGDTTVVGTRSLSAYAYLNNALQQRLDCPSSIRDVSVSGDTAAIGLSGNSADVFTRTSGVWTQQQTLTALDSTSGNLFGWSIAISGDRIIVGSTGADVAPSSLIEKSRNSDFVPQAANQGAAYSFIHASPTAATVSVSGRILAPNGAGLKNAIVTMTGGSLAQPIVRRSTSFGYFSFEGIEVGQLYIITVSSNRYRFPQENFIITPYDNISDIVFRAIWEN